MPYKKLFSEVVPEQSHVYSYGELSDVTCPHCESLIGSWDDTPEEGALYSCPSCHKMFEVESVDITVKVMLKKW